MTGARRTLSRASEHLGEEAAQRWVQATYPQAEKIFGDITRAGVPGEFDQIWRVPRAGPDGGPLYLVLEAKGGSGTLGVRRVGEQTVQQGTPEYFDAILEVMEGTGSPEALAAVSELRATPNAIRYLEVSTPVRTRAGAPALSDMRIREFDLGPRR